MKLVEKMPGGQIRNKGDRISRHHIYLRVSCICSSVVAKLRLVSALKANPRFSEHFLFSFDYMCISFCAQVGQYRCSLTILMFISKSDRSKPKERNDTVGVVSGSDLMKGMTAELQLLSGGNGVA
jgi:hypothetical protein